MFLQRSVLQRLLLMLAADGVGCGRCWPTAYLDDEDETVECRKYVQHCNFLLYFVFIDNTTTRQRNNTATMNPQSQSINEPLHILPSATNEETEYDWNGTATALKTQVQARLAVKQQEFEYMLDYERRRRTESARKKLIKRTLTQTTFSTIKH